MALYNRNRLPQLYKRKQMTPQLTTVYVPVKMPQEGSHEHSSYMKPLTGYFLTPEEMDEVKALLSYFVNVDAVIHFKSAQAQHEYNAKLREAKSILNLLNKQP